MADRIPVSLATAKDALRELTRIGDHVDILGRSSLNDLILKVAGGKGDTIEDTYFSDIHKYADKVKVYDDEDDSEQHHDG